MHYSAHRALSFGLILLQATSLASPVTNHVKHEERSTSSNRHWKRQAPVEDESIIPLRIGLAQSNLDSGAEHLLSISDHESPLYGKHWTVDEVHEFFAPSEAAVDDVRNWLISSGIAADEIVHSENRGWLALDIPASKVNQLFRTTIHEFEHDGSLRLGCDQYHVPAHLSEHIDYITPGVKLSAPVKKRNGQRVARRTLPATLESRDLAASGTSLRHCDKVVTPECIRALYGLPIPTHADPANAPGFFEQGDYYSQEDLNGFFTNYAPSIKNGTGPVKALIDGAVDPKSSNSKQVTGEADGDLEVAFGLVHPTIPIVYQVDDPHYAKHELKTFNLFNTFLDALDGSYCNYTAYGITGDSWRDPHYPDPAKNGYKGKLQCGTLKPATVISISYGEAENDIPIRYDKRQCNEWMKLSLSGHTILTASGDYGVAGFPGDGSNNGCLVAVGEHGKNGTVFNPDYLSSCPYITSVGGTEILPGNSVEQPEQAALVYFPNDSYPYSSSGGFSNYFKRPHWQDSAVQSWLSKYGKEYPSYVANAKASNVGEKGGLYNRAGRAYPDVSANSARLGLVFNGALSPGYGTSFASPIWASTISLINTARSEAGKGPVGFINQVLYAHPHAMHDVTNGTNPGCGTNGFSAVPGWEPVAGLGTPNYSELLKVFMALP